MKTMFRLAKFIIMALLIFSLHLFFISRTGFPFNQINLIYIFLACLMISSDNPRIIWSIFFISFLMELYSSLPFGLNAGALIVSLLFFQWSLINFFTNHTWYMVGLVGMLSSALYHFILFALLALTDVFSKDFNFIFNRQLIYSIFLEMIFIGIAISIIYSLILAIKNRLSKNNKLHKGYDWQFGPFQGI